MKSRGGFAEMAPMFEEMQLNGTRAVGVLSAVASHLDQVRTAQDTLTLKAKKPLLSAVVMLPLMLHVQLSVAALMFWVCSALKAERKCLRAKRKFLKPRTRVFK